MKILVTGGAGFIGSAVVRQAVRAGHEVVNLDVLTYAALTNTNTAQVQSRVETVVIGCTCTKEVEKEVIQ